MVILNGMVYQGKVIPDTDWVFRDPACWYKPTDDDVFPRIGAPSLLVFHWTAGPRRDGVAAGQKTYTAMQARRDEDGSEMSVSAQFVISDDGVVMQLADLDLCTYNADRRFNKRGVGIEYSFPGTVKQSALVKQPIDPHEDRIVAGNRIDCVLPNPLALVAGIQLADKLAEVFKIPKVTYTQRSRFNSTQMYGAAGACEHYHASSTTKVDVAGFFVDALAKGGWTLGKP